MDVIRPVTITDSNLTSTNVAEDDYAEFSMGTTYAEGDMVIDSTGVEIITLDVAPVTDWEVGDLITGQSSSETAYVVLKLTDLTYQIRERTGNFTLGEIIGETGTANKLADQGAAYPTITAATDFIHEIYESLGDANTANYPYTDVDAAVPSWIKVSDTNPWKMFDQSVTTATSNASTITVILTPGYIDTIVFLNTNCDSLNVTITSVSGGGEIFNETQSGIEPTSLGWWSYFFDHFVIRTEFVFDDITPYNDSIVTITITKTGTATCGVCVIGLSKFIGNAQYPLRRSVKDLSRKEEDAYGNLRITEGNFLKRMTVPIYTDRYQTIETERFINEYRSALLVFIANADFPTTLIYGFVYSWEYSMVSIDRSNWNMTIEGVI